MTNSANDSRCIVFSNPGEIDRRLITTMGVHVKASSSPIGFFGTGLKYGISVWLRNGCQVTILSGLTTFRFTTMRQAIRGKDFELICMEEILPDGTCREHELGFTTELGKNWLPWMAYREFWANAQDEGGGTFQANEVPPATAGFTKIVVVGEAASKAFEHRNEWMLLGPADVVMPGLEIRYGSSGVGYYHGIRVTTLARPGLFTYNLTGQYPLTEDRTIDGFDYSWAVASKVKAGCVDAEILETLLTAGERNIEQDWYWANATAASPAFVQAVQTLQDLSPGTVSHRALEAVRGQLAKPIPIPVTLTVVQKMMLAKAKAFLAGIGHEITERVTVVDGLGGPLILGLARDGEILLSRLVLEKGTKYVASTLLEEHLHCKHGFGDMTREFQTWLLDRVVSLGEELRGEPL